jgi:hypothetical protein
MALALLVLLETKLPDAEAIYTKAATGKALIREADRVDSTARRKNVTSLSAMLSENQSALIAQLIADGFDPSKMRLPPEMWYTAADGLKSVRAIAEYVNANLNDFKQPRPILRDLQAIELLLTAAEAASVRFHFIKDEL